MNKTIGSISALIALSAATASADIVASPFINVGLDIGDGSEVDIDMDSNGTNDFVLRNFNNSSGTIIGEVGNEIYVIDLASSNTMNFNYGAEISLSETATNTAHWTNLISQGVSYVGVKFQVNGQTNLGWIQFNLPNSSTGCLVRGAWESTHDKSIFVGYGLANVTPTNGPLTGGNMALITNAAPNIGNGSDITNIVVGTVGTTNILDQGTNWVRMVMPAVSSAGAKDIVIQSGSVGNTTLANAYTYTTTCILPAPTGVSATDGTYTNMVQVTWQGVAGATSYEILRNTTPDVNGATVLADVPAAEALRLTPTTFSLQSTVYYYNDTTVVGRLSYYYWVRALSGSGVSALSYVGMGYAELGSGQTVGRSDLTVSDMVFLPVNLTNGSPAGTVSYRLANGGPDALTTAPVRFDFYMVQGDQAVWMAYNETNVTLAVGAEQLLILDASARQWLRVRGDLAGQYTVQTRVRHLALIGDGHTGSNVTDAAGTVLVKASGVNSPGRSLNDYDGDGKADVCVYQSTLGRWYAKLSEDRYYADPWIGDVGMGWTPVPGDYDGDGITDVAAYNLLRGQWLVRLSSNGLVGECRLGGPEFTAAQCDFDGDSKTDPMVYREADGYWLGAASSRAYALAYAFLGETGYRSVIADYDGDGLADPAVYNRTTGFWAISLSGRGYQPLVTGTFGGSGFLSATADYDGDGLADPAIYAPGTAYWQVLMSRSLATQGVYTWCGDFMGTIGGLPVSADYDGDGLADPAVYHQDTSLWELFPSANDYQLVWGLFGGPEYAPVTE